MKTKIQIGHPAYRGDNALKYTNSKAAAVRELRARGVTRNIARRAVNLACAKQDGYQTVTSGKWGDVIEVFNRTGETFYTGESY